jgi:hypothetical protein
MPGTVVGLYCAVVERFELLASARTIAAQETQAVTNRRAECLRTWLGALNLGLGEAGGHNPENAPGGLCTRRMSATQAGGMAFWPGAPFRDFRKWPSPAHTWNGREPGLAQIGNSTALERVRGCETGRSVAPAEVDTQTSDSHADENSPLPSAA